MANHYSIIKLNVGGQNFQTTASTLRGSEFLTRMIEGEIPTLKDENGAYFIDRDPKCFEIILSYLRTFRWDIPSDIDREKLFQEAEFYLLTDLVLSRSKSPVGLFVGPKGKLFIENDLCIISIGDSTIQQATLNSQNIMMANNLEESESSEESEKTTSSEESSSSEKSISSEKSTSSKESSSSEESTSSKESISSEEDELKFENGIFINDNKSFIMTYAEKILNEPMTGFMGICSSARPLRPTVYDIISKDLHHSWMKACPGKVFLYPEAEKRKELEYVTDPETNLIFVSYKSEKITMKAYFFNVDTSVIHVNRTWHFSKGKFEDRTSKSDKDSSKSRAKEENAEKGNIAKKPTYKYSYAYEDKY